ncbi:MAG: Uma2 family endonuclease [Nannocystaceae bacterium]
MTRARKLGRPAVLADLDDLPPTWRGEILGGELYAFPRPRFAHAHVEGYVYMDICSPFERGHGGGPGGWWILVEPGIHLPSAAEFSPDVAGWRRTTMLTPPRSGPITAVPDWLCEILSPRTRGYDLVVKRRFYAEIGVSHLWYVDPAARALTVSRLQDGHWVELGVHGPDETVRAEPFEAVAIDLSQWWSGLPEEPTEDEA